jgi:hypothetical protein
MAVVARSVTAFAISADERRESLVVIREVTQSCALSTMKGNENLMERRVEFIRGEPPVTDRV